MINGDDSASPILATEQSVYNQQPMEPQAGLTKRELFSAMAMQGICANQYYSGRHSNAAIEITIKATEIADALINSLNNTTISYED